MIKEREFRLILFYVKIMFASKFISNTYKVGKKWLYQMEFPEKEFKKSEIGVSLVTGGAGFIGSHIVDRLIENNIEVKILDNLSKGALSNLNKSKNKKNFQFVKNDLSDFDHLKMNLKDVNSVFHMAANSEVRSGFNHPEISYKENIENTFFLLEAIRKTNVQRILFASSSTVYGEPKIIPTPENYGPLIPISPYGASKLASEALISSYCHTYGINGLIFRFANIVGSRSNHGVIIDFINKLSQNSENLEILGDGKQSKSYLHVSDCVDSFFFCLDNATKKVEIFNVGNNDETNVITIGNIVCNSMDLPDVELKTTGGVEGGRGWIGDVKRMHLDITKLSKLGWAPKLNSEQAIELATKELL